MTRCESSDVFEHDACEGDEMEVCEGLGTSFVVLDEPSEPRCPCEGSLDDPSFGQQDKAALGLGQLDDLKSDAVFGGCGGGLVADVALVDEGDLDAFAGLSLNGLGDPADFGAVVGIGRGDMKRQKMTERIDGQMQL